MPAPYETTGPPRPAPAPLPEEAVVSALAPFGSSTTLPAAAYTSPAVLAWERRHLFAGSWLCVGRTSELAAGCTQRAVRAGNLGVLLTFTHGDGSIVTRAFANVCRHRGHELLRQGECFDRRALVCPYHGWSFELTGALRTAPRMSDSFDVRPYGLVELPAIDWCGWLFVNASGTARPFPEHLGALDSRIGAYQPGRLVVKARHRYEVSANWKLIVENYHECYHCPQVHPQLCVVSPPNSGSNWHDPGAWVGGTMELREHAVTMSMDGTSRGVFLDGVEPRIVVYVGLFPNLLISAHPDYVLTHRLEPLAPARTRIECEWLFDPEVTDPSYAVEFWDVTNRQDWAACESVQRGVFSPHYRPGPLAPNENAVYDWITMIARAYLDPTPPAGT